MNGRAQKTFSRPAARDGSPIPSSIIDEIRALEAISAASSRPVDAGDQLQQRALAGTVAADEPDRLAAFDPHRDVPERPELLDGLTLLRVKQAQEADLQLHRGVVAAGTA